MKKIYNTTRDAGKFPVIECDHIKRLREEYGITVYQIAKSLNTSWQTVNHWVAGRHQPTNPFQILLWAKYEPQLKDMFKKKGTNNAIRKTTQQT